MNFGYSIKQHFSIHGIPINDADLPFIQHIHHTILQVSTPLTSQTELNQEVPITIVDPELILYD